MRKYFIGGAIALLLLPLAAAIGSYTGIYNVAADEPHFAITYWFLDNTMRHSVAARADSIDAPATFTDQQETAGFQHFRSTCVPCHGSVGVHGEAGGNMRPNPPPLRHAASEWNNAELFWIAKHGIKMTGMPAFGATHSDADLWNIVAFVRKLPDIAPAEYQRMIGEPNPQVRQSVYELGEEILEDKERAEHERRAREAHEHESNAQPR